MKVLNKIILVIICLNSCKGPFLDDSDLLSEKETKATVKKSVILTSSLLNGSLIEKDFIEGRNYFYKTLDREIFLFLTCNSDCGEKLESYLVKQDKSHVVFFTKNSSRFKTRNRLLLFRLESDQSTKVFDSVRDKYKSFKFEGSDFIYILEDGTEKKISLQ